jgi:hypothetical protein
MNYVYLYQKPIKILKRTEREGEIREWRKRERSAEVKNSGEIPKPAEFRAHPSIYRGVRNLEFLPREF